MPSRATGGMLLLTGRKPKARTRKTPTRGWLESTPPEPDLKQHFQRPRCRQWGRRNPSDRNGYHVPRGGAWQAVRQSPPIERQSDWKTMAQENPHQAQKVVEKARKKGTMNQFMKKDRKGLVAVRFQGLDTWNAGCSNDPVGKVIHENTPSCARKLHWALQSKHLKQGQKKEKQARR